MRLPQLRWPESLIPFSLLREDFRSFRSRYLSDWTPISPRFRSQVPLRPRKVDEEDDGCVVLDSRPTAQPTAFNQQVLASAVYMFFTNLLPGITFASDLYILTGQQWGTIEIVFSTGLCGVIFSLLSAQPLTILGVTGPFSVLAENIYTLCVDTFHIPFLQFMAWTFIHSAWMHILLAIFNAHNWTMCYVTTFSTEIFALLNSIIYFHKAIQELERAHDSLSFAGFLYSIIGAIGTFFVAVFLSTAESWKPLLHKYIRIGLREYAAAISIVIFIGLPNGGELGHLDKDRLPVSTSFKPTSADRDTFIVKFWELSAGWVFAALIPGFIITVLFYFDHEVSSIICTIDRYGTRKPGGYAWDIVLLGITTAMCGIIGVPPSNGLLPQAPLHSESLLHDEKEEKTLTDEQGSEKTEIVLRPRVYEQRWSHFLHAAGILCFVSPPLMHVLGLTPTSVLAGLFMFMGEQSLSVNPILYRFFNILTPPSELPKLPANVKGYLPVHLYTVVQIVVTTGIFIVTLTVAGPCFPIIIIALVPIRLLLMNKMWNRETLRFVDAWACKEGTPEDDEDRKNEPEAAADIPKETSGS